jgi:hypothetical protein
MTKQEMRFIRREFINIVLHWGVKSLYTVKFIVRQAEYDEYHTELQAYA